MPNPPSRHLSYLPFALTLGGLVLLAWLSGGAGPVRAQACPPYCQTPVITPAWHLHMCDVSYQEQLSDNHCMRGKGVTEFPAGTDTVYIIYCHKYTDLVGIQVKDQGGGLQFVNHPDGVTYTGEGCDTVIFYHRNGIPPGGSPYYTSAFWPEGPFSGIGAGIEWYIGLFVAFDQENYYGNAAEAFITARDPAANQDVFTAETITVRLTSPSDPVGIDVVLTEDQTNSSIFRSSKPLKFSQDRSNAAVPQIKVANRDAVKVTYCPRSCQTPYVDTATWYQINATITPTFLPTWSGPAPTNTPTPAPGERLETLVLRPAPADVGYVPQVSTNRDRKNHLGYPTMYSGMWTKGTNGHYGMVQFNLGAVPAGVNLRDARLEMIGRDHQFTQPGSWIVKLLDSSLDAGWRDATFDMVRTAPAVAQVGPTLGDGDLGVNRRNTFGFTADQLHWIQERLASSRKLSFRVEGPGGQDNNLFGWHTGVDVFNRESKPPDPSLGPSITLVYALPGAVPTNEPTSTVRPTLPPGVTPSPTPSPLPTNTATRTPSPGPSPTPTRTNTLPPGVTPSATPTASRTPTTGAIPTVPVFTPSPTPFGIQTATNTPPYPGPSATFTPVGTLPTSGPTPDSTVGPSATPPEPASATPSPIASATPRPTLTLGPGTGTARQVCVVAYDDRNQDHERQTNERLMAGVTLRLTHVRTGVFTTWTTDGGNLPDYCWNGLTDGEYSLAAIRWPTGYASSGANEVRFVIPMDSPSQYEFGARPSDAATATRTPTAVPSGPPTPAPTVYVTVTPLPTVTGPAGEVCVSVFADANLNGLQDDGEPLVADILFDVLGEQSRPVVALLSRSDGPLCAKLATGVYFVQAASAPGLRFTTARRQGLLVTDRGQERLVFGLAPASPPGQIVFLPQVLKRVTGRR